MRALIAIPCFIVVLSPNSIEAPWPFRRTNRENNAIHAEPLELAARLHASFIDRDRTIEITAGFHKVATEVKDGNEYVIGYIEDGPQGNILCPFVDGIAHIKIRIDGDHANVYYPIFRKDPVNDLLFKEYKEEGLRTVEIKSRNLSLPLIMARH